jgi:stage III sporulation protein AE
MIAAGFLAVMILGILPDEAWGALVENETEIFGLDDFDFSDVDQFLQKKNGDFPLTMESVMGDLMEGDFGTLLGRIANGLRQALFSEISLGSRLMGQVLALGFVGAVFTNFSTVFQGSEISETGFFITYILLFTFLAASMMESMALTAGVVEDVLEFMKILMPSYFLAVAFAGGSVSAVVMYEFTLWVMTAGQWFLGAVILPLVKIYVLLAMAGNLVKEEFLSRLTELLGQAAGWGLKTVPGLMLGFHLIQGLILPYVDSLKQGAVEKAVSMIPGIGQGASAVTKLLVGSGVLIKNTIGAAAMVILMALIAMPVLKLAVLLVMYQCVAAVMEPVCDKRLVNCVMAAAKGQKMMVQVVACAALILVITVAVVCAGTNVTYYA